MDGRPSNGIRGLEDPTETEGKPGGPGDGLPRGVEVGHIGGWMSCERKRLAGPAERSQWRWPS